MADPVARILLVEDEPDLANLVEVNLRLADYEVVVARSGEEGLAAVQEVRPDAVLLDVMLPGIDGWDVLRSIKEDRATRDLPVVMLTALGDERDLIRGHLQGAVEYVTKPFELRQLLTTLQEVLADATEEERAERRRRTRTMLTRLAELDSGRSAQSQVSLSSLEHPPESSPPVVLAPTPAQEQGLDSMTRKQRWVAAALGAGWGARAIAQHLGVSRSNIYATRRRVARRLACRPDEVAEVARTLGITDEVPAPPDGHDGS